jgi:hypothetical protein
MRSLIGNERGVRESNKDGTQENCSIDAEVGKAEQRQR